MRKKRPVRGLEKRNQEHFINIHRQKRIERLFPAQLPQGFIENGLKKRKNPKSVALWVKTPCLCQRSEKNGQTASSQKEGNINSNNHLLKPRYAEELI